MTERQSVPAVARALNILELLAANPEGLSAGEILAQLPVNRSSLFALLQTLKQRGYLMQPTARGPYRLGPALRTLMPGQMPAEQALIDRFYATTALTELPETVGLFRLEGRHTLLLGQRQPQTAVRVVHTPGERCEAWGTAAGQVLLAGLPTAERTNPPPEFAAEILTGVQKSGLSRTTAADVVQIAAPVCPNGVQPTAALQLSIPAYRCEPNVETTLTARLRQAAARLSYRLGAAVYQPYGWAIGDPVGPTRTLAEKELHAFLAEPWGGRLACVRGDGTPHVVPLWYEWDGAFVWLTASPGAFWKHYVLESSRVSLTIDEPWPPLRRVFIVGEAVAVGETAVPGGLSGLRRRLAVRYLGAGAEKQTELTETDGWTALRITPLRINGRQGLGSS